MQFDRISLHDNLIEASYCLTTIEYRVMYYLYAKCCATSKREDFITVKELAKHLDKKESYIMRNLRDFASALLAKTIKIESIRVPKDIITINWFEMIEFNCKTKELHYVWNKEFLPYINEQAYVDVMIRNVLLVD